MGWPTVVAVVSFQSGTSPLRNFQRAQVFTNGLADRLLLAEVLEKTCRTIRGLRKLEVYKSRETQRVHKIVMILLVEHHNMLTCFLY